MEALFHPDLWSESGLREDKALNTDVLPFLLLESQRLLLPRISDNRPPSTVRDQDAYLLSYWSDPAQSQCCTVASFQQDLMTLALSSMDPCIELYC
jgi:hypothetical protein